MRYTIDYQNKKASCEEENKLRMEIDNELSILSEAIQANNTQVIEDTKKRLTHLVEDLSQISCEI